MLTHGQTDTRISGYVKTHKAREGCGDKSGFRPVLNKIRGLVSVKHGVSDIGGSTWQRPIPLCVRRCCRLSGIQHPVFGGKEPMRIAA